MKCTLREEKRSPGNGHIPLLSFPRVIQKLGENELPVTVVFSRAALPSQQAERVGRAAATVTVGIAASARCETVWLPAPGDAARLFPCRRRSRFLIRASKAALALSRL